MATWADVETAVSELPEVEEGTSYGHRAWKVRGTTFVWDRPFSKRDLRDLGDDAPGGPVLAVRVEDLGERDAILATPDRGSRSRTCGATPPCSCGWRRPPLHRSPSSSSTPGAPWHRQSSVRGMTAEQPVTRGRRPRRPTAGQPSTCGSTVGS